MAWNRGIDDDDSDYNDEHENNNDHDLDLPEEAFNRLRGRQWNSGPDTVNMNNLPADINQFPFLSTSPHADYLTRRKHAGLPNYEPLELTIQNGKNKKVKFSFPNCLYHRENGMTSQCNFYNQVLRSKLRQLKWVAVSQVEFSDYVNCYYVTGFKRQIICAWTYHEHSTLLLKSIYFYYRTICNEWEEQASSISKCYHNHITGLNNYKVFDMCGLSIGGRNYVLFVANTHSRENNIAHLIPIKTSDVIAHDSTIRKFNHQDILWSCAWNENRKKFAIGADRCIYLHDYENFSQKIDLLKGQPHSLDFNKNGNILYCGIHQGCLVCFDLRAEPVAVLTVPFSKNISYIKTLSDERTVIASGFNNALANIDLRSKKEVFQYPNHYSFYKKLTFSFDESTNVLCCPGEDNITRLWSLNNGDLLHSLSLPKNKDYCGQINSLYETDGRRMYVHVSLGDSIHSFESLEHSTDNEFVYQFTSRLRY